LDGISTILAEECTSVMHHAVVIVSSATRVNPWGG